MHCQTTSTTTCVHKAASWFGGGTNLVTVLHELRQVEQSLCDLSNVLGGER